MVVVCHFLAFCCQAQEKKERHNSVDSSFLQRLITTQIGQSAFFISIPSDYKITERRSVDFSVYYFSPIDTTNTSSFSGGLYLGGFPSLSGPENNFYKDTILKRKLFNKYEEWTQYSCNETYSIQTIANIGNYSKIHAFGNAKSKPDIDKILIIFSTLSKKVSK